MLGSGFGKGKSATSSAAIAENSWVAVYKGVPRT